MSFPLLFHLKGVLTCLPKREAYTGAVPFSTVFRQGVHSPAVTRLRLSPLFDIASNCLGNEDVNSHASLYQRGKRLSSIILIRTVLKFFSHPVLNRSLVVSHCDFLSIAPNYRVGYQFCFRFYGGLFLLF